MESLPLCHKSCRMCTGVCGENENIDNSCFEAIAEGRIDIPNHKLNPHAPASCSLFVASAMLAKCKTPSQLSRRNWRFD